MKKTAGPKMQQVVSFVAANPGQPMIRAARAVGPNGSLQYGYRAVNRAIAAGLVWPVRDAARGGVVRLYPIVACRAHEDCAESLTLAIECVS